MMRALQVEDPFLPTIFALVEREGKRKLHAPKKTLTLGFVY